MLYIIYIVLYDLYTLYMDLGLIPMDSQQQTAFQISSRGPAKSNLKMQRTIP